MLKSPEGQAERPSLLMGLSLEEGKASTCLGQQRNCNWVGCCGSCCRKYKYLWAASASRWDPDPVGAAVSLISADGRGSVSSLLLLGLGTALPYLWQKLPAATVVFRRQNSVLFALLRSLSQIWLPKRLQVSISYSISCLLRGWAGITFLPSY